MRKVEQKYPITEVIFVLDRSGSMEKVTNDTIGGFNSMIKKQKQEGVDALVTTVLFDDEMSIIHDRIKIKDVPLLTNREYYARGTTALLDAVGSTITHISNIHKYARKEDVPSKTLFVITTDGYENASSKYTLTKVKSMIEEQKDNGWEFLFLGANIDAVETASKMGIAKEYAANVINDKEGIATTYRVVSNAVLDCLISPRGAKLSKKWKEELENDLKRGGGSPKTNNKDEEEEVYIPEFLRR